MADAIDPRLIAALMAEREGRPSINLPAMPSRGRYQGEMRSANEFPLSDLVGQTVDSMAGRAVDATAKFGRSVGQTLNGNNPAALMMELARSSWPASAEAQGAPDQGNLSTPDRLQQLMQQRQSIDNQRAVATADRDAELKGKGGAKAGRGPNYDAKQVEIERLSKELATIDGFIADERRNQSPQYKAEMEKVGEAEAVRRQMLGEAPKPFHQEYPNWAKIQPAVPALASAITVGGTALVDALASRIGARNWRKAANLGLKTTNPEEMRVASDTASRYGKAFPEGKSELPKYLAAGGVGALEGAGLTNYPEYYNANLPGANPERAAYEEYVKRLPAGRPEIEKAQALIKDMPEKNLARESALAYFDKPLAVTMRTGLGAIEGAAGAVAGTKASGAAGPREVNLPRPQTYALSERLTRELATIQNAQQQAALKPLKPLIIRQSEAGTHHYAKGAPDGKGGQFVSNEVLEGAATKKKPTPKKAGEPELVKGEIQIDDLTPYGRGGSGE